MDIYAILLGLLFCLMAGIGVVVSIQWTVTTLPRVRVIVRPRYEDAD